MKKKRINGLPGKNVHREKILLVLLPFWSTMIPPIGIACLKSYLTGHPYDIKTVDANVEMNFRDYYDGYFDILRKIVPENKRGNFYSIGHDVLRNHMMAYLDYENEREYRELVKISIGKTFYVDVDNAAVFKLNKIVAEFYKTLETYVLNLLEIEKPSLLGLSVYSDTLPASIFTFKLAREMYPHIKTVMGGGVFADLLADGSQNLDIFLEQTEGEIDHIIIGEGEILFHKLLSGELEESQRVYTLNDINGEILDLSSANTLDMADFDLRNYPYIVSYASRSCPFQCSFCSETIQWGKYRKKDSKQVFKELMELYQRHGSQLFLLSDSLLNPVIADIADELYKAEAALYWGGWLRVDKPVCDIENTLRWRRGGFYHARLGIESGSPDVLKLMGKYITPAQVKASATALANVGIKTTTLWIVGHPGETEADFQQTLDLIEELRNDIYEAECRPFYYYLTGQVGARDDWWGKVKKVPLYPEKVEKMVKFQTWLLDCEPSRETAYRRMNRFVEHCRKLGIPNPYSLHEIYEADVRWKKLHKNAVPALVEFKNTDNYIMECKRVKNLQFIKKTNQGAGGFKEYVDFSF